MATKSRTLPLSASFTRVLQGVLGKEVIAFAVQFANSSATPAVVTVRHYVQSEGVAHDTDVPLAANNLAAWPKVALQPGDYLDAASDNEGVRVLVSWDEDDGTDPVASTLVPRGAYSNVAEYGVNHFVSYEGAAYVSLEDANTGNTPDASPQWMVFAEVPQALIDTAVADAVAALLDGAPGALDTLNELAAALGDDPNFATSVTTLINARALAATTVTGGGLASGGGTLEANRVITVTAATAAQVAAATAADVVVTPAAQSGALNPEAITWASTITPNFSTRATRSVVLGGNTTFATPVGMKKGEVYSLWVYQDGTGSRTGAFDVAYKWTGTTPTLSTGPGWLDILTLICLDGATQACAASLTKGFQP